MAASIATTALMAAKAALRGELKRRLADIPHEELFRQSKLVTEKVGFLIFLNLRTLFSKFSILFLLIYY